MSWSNIRLNIKPEYLQGGQIIYDSTQADAVAAAMLNYSSGTSDDYIKSGMVCTYMYLEGEVRENMKTCFM
jgi:hypothetical protein